MATKKVTITISEEALEKIEIQSKALDITSNTYIKQLAMNHVNNSKFTWFTQEQRLAIQDFSYKQSQLINTLRKIDEKLLKKGIQFPTQQVQNYFKSYHKHFKQYIERLADGNN